MAATVSKNSSSSGSALQELLLVLLKTKLSKKYEATRVVVRVWTAREQECELNMSSYNNMLYGCSNW